MEREIYGLHVTFIDEVVDRTQPPMIQSLPSSGVRVAFRDTLCGPCGELQELGTLPWFQVFTVGRAANHSLSEHIQYQYTYIYIYIYKYATEEAEQNIPCNL